MRINKRLIKKTLNCEYKYSQPDKNLLDLISYYSIPGVLENDLDAIMEIQNRIQKNAPELLKTMDNIIEGVNQLGIEFGKMFIKFENVFQDKIIDDEKIRQIMFEKDLL